MGTNLELTPAVGSAEPAGHPVAHGPRQSPTAPDISNPGMGKIPHQPGCQAFFHI